MKKLTREDLVTIMATMNNISQTSARVAVDGVLDALKSLLSSDQDNIKLTLPKFGNFWVVTAKSRKARNPRTGESVNVPEKRKILFKPGLPLKKQIQKSDEE